MSDENPLKFRAAENNIEKTSPQLVLSCLEVN